MDSAFSLTVEQDISQSCFKSNVPDSVWPTHTFPSLAPTDSELESHSNEVEALKVQVKDLFLETTRELTNNIQFINSLCRLGISHHFQDEIEEQLNCLSQMIPKFVVDNDYDLRTVANFFRVMRQHGYSITCDVFKNFTLGDGEFKKDIIDDIKGIVCFYEACFLAIPGEDILHEALNFTRKHLEILVETSNPSLQKYIRHVLMSPCHRSIERLDALRYISYYEEDEYANEALFKFAKLDFNGQQLLNRKELALLSEWWIDLDVKKKLPYCRDRLAESYLWSIGCIYEPQHSLSRMMVAKYLQLMTLIDDTYDTHGTFEHLQLLTNALHRLTLDASDELPECMKHIVKIIFDDLESNGTKGLIFKDSENNSSEGRSHKTSYLEEIIKEMTRSYIVEAKWKKEGKAPSFDEYMKIGRVSSGVEIVTSPFILGSQLMATEEITWVRNQPQIVIAAQFIGRLMNDITGITVTRLNSYLLEAEYIHTPTYLSDKKQRQDFPKGYHCYMEQYGVSRDEAVEAIQKIIENKWQVINEEMIKTSNAPKILLKLTLNYCRIIHLLYGGGTDVFTYPSHLKELVTSMFFKPFPL